MLRTDRVRPFDFTDGGLIDDEDTIDSEGGIVWNHSKNIISPTKVSQHLKIPTRNENTQVRSLKETPTIKEPFDEYLKNIHGVGSYRKLTRLIALIRRKYEIRTKCNSQYTLHLCSAFAVYIDVLNFSCFISPNAIV